MMPKGEGMTRAVVTPRKTGPHKTRMLAEGMTQGAVMTVRPATATATETATATVGAGMMEVGIRVVTS
jgi:hypothetical protein